MRGKVRTDLTGKRFGRLLVIEHSKIFFYTLIKKMTNFKFIPLGRRVLVRTTGKMSLTEGSKIIQAETVQAPLMGEVIEVGEGEYATSTGVFIPTKVKKGDNVLFLEGSGGDVKSHGMDLILLNEDNLIGTY